MEKEYVKIERRCFTKKEKEKMLSKTNCLCAHCGMKLDTDTMTVDHVFPIDKGGLHDEYNLLPLCEPCNKKKSNYVYSFSQFYKHIRKDEVDKFHEYNSYATFDYTRQSIIGYDEVVFKFLPEKSMWNMHNMMKKKRSKADQLKMYNALKVSVILRKAYPAAADEIFAMIQKNKGTVREMSNLYKSSYDVLNDIESGCVYTLENHNRICGAFIFKDTEKINENIQVIQMQNIMEEVGLKPKYIMTYATVSVFAYPVLDDVMKYLETCQLQNGWMPVYFGIINKIYAAKEECIIMPFEIAGTQSTLEFMPIRHLKDRRRDVMNTLFKEHGYKDATDYEKDLCADLTLRYMYLRDAMTADGAEDLFKKYPEMQAYFKPDAFELYGAGIQA